MNLIAINGFDVLVGLAVTITLMYVLIVRIPNLARWLGVIA